MTTAEEPSDTFEVVAIARESDALLDFWARETLALGPQRITVHLDQEAPTWTPPPGVEAVRLAPELRAAGNDDDGVWDLVKMQHAVYRQAYERCEADWLLVIDVDEFIDASVALGALLARAGPGEDSFIFSVAEAVGVAGDDEDALFGFTGFRLRMPIRRRSRLIRRLIYGRSAGLFEPVGLLGHMAGKYAVRCGLDGVQPIVHVALRGEEVISAPVERLLRPGEHARCLHFDAVRFERWADKWRIRASGMMRAGERSERLAQIKGFKDADAKGEAALRRLFRRQHGLGPLRFAVLRALGVAYRDPSWIKADHPAATAPPA